MSKNRALSESPVRALRQASLQGCSDARGADGCRSVWAIRLGHACGTDPVQMWKGANSPSLGAGVSPVSVQIWQG